MARGTIEFALQPKPLDQLFQQHSEQQYTRELLFSSLVDLLALVVWGTHQSVRASYLATPEQLAVSLTWVYDKLAGVETQVSAELVRYTFRQLGPVLRQLGAGAAKLRRPDMDQQMHAGVGPGEQRVDRRLRLVSRVSAVQVVDEFIQHKSEVTYLRCFLRSLRWVFSAIRWNWSVSSRRAIQAHVATKIMNADLRRCTCRG